MTNKEKNNIVALLMSNILYIGLAIFGIGIIGAIINFNLFFMLLVLVGTMIMFGCLIFNKNIDNENHN